MQARKKPRPTSFDFIAKDTFKQSIIRLLDAKMEFWSQDFYCELEVYNRIQILRSELVHFKTYYPNLANNEQALDLLMAKLKHLLSNNEFKLDNPKKPTRLSKFYNAVKNDNEAYIAKLVSKLIIFYEYEHEKIVYRLCSEEPRLIDELSERSFISKYRKFQRRNNLASHGEPHSGIVNLMDFMASRLCLDQSLMGDFMNHLTLRRAASQADWTTFYRIIKSYVCDHMTKDKIIFDLSFPNLERLLVGLNYLSNRNVFHKTSVTERNFLTSAMRSIIESVARCDWLLQYLCAMTDLVSLTNQVYEHLVHGRVDDDVNFGTLALGVRFLMPHIFKLFVDGDYEKLLQLCTTFKIHGIDYRHCMRNLLESRRKLAFFNASFGLLQCKKLGSYPYNQLSNDVIKLIANKTVREPEHEELKSRVDELYIATGSRRFSLDILTRHLMLP